MATRRFLMIDRVVYVKARINGLVGVFLRMDLVALERVMVEVRRRGWICICKLTKRMLAKFVLERKFPQSASTWWVKNFSTLLVVSCECLWKWWCSCKHNWGCKWIEKGWWWKSLWFRGCSDRVRCGIVKELSLDWKQGVRIAKKQLKKQVSWFGLPWAMDERGFAKARCIKVKCRIVDCGLCWAIGRTRAVGPSWTYQKPLWQTKLMGGARWEGWKTKIQP